MYLIPHPGLCCGVACIYGFSYDPNAVLPALTSALIAQYKLAYPTWILPEGAPAETGEKRLRRMIQYRENTRWSGIIEVVLTTKQLLGWAEVLDRYHFKESCRNLNSNSNNTIVVFHRLSGAEGVDKITTI